MFNPFPESSAGAGSRPNFSYSATILEDDDARDKPGHHDFFNESKI
jgi:hypothetical protein